MGGDFNFLAAGERPRRIEQTSPGLTPDDTQQYMLDAAPADAAASYKSRQMESLWQSILGKMVDISGEHTTHYAANSCAVSRIDRIYCIAPSWLLDRMNLRISLDEDPYALHIAGVSDHAPIDVILEPRSVSRADKRAVPSWIARDELFVQFLRDLDSCACWTALSPGTELAEKKKLLRGAADLVEERRRIPGCLSMDRQKAEHLSHLARVVVSNNVARAKKLIEFFLGAHEHISVDRAHVLLRDPVAFDKEHAAVRARLLSTEI